MDPLVALPHELVLRILTYLDLPALTKVELLSRTWNALSKFHSRLLWAAQAQAMDDEKMRVTGLEARQVGVTDADLSAAIDQKACAMRDTWTGIGDWKEYCKRQYLITSNLAREHPSFVSQEFRTVDAWRLRVDYEARLLIVTSIRGGLFVYDLDSSPSTPELLWSRNGEEIGPYAHLEYSKGTLATNPSVEGTIEIWRRTELIGAEKLRALGHSINDPDSGRSTGARDTKQARISPGTFTRLGRLPHDNSVRGFHLRYHTLCVVSEMRRAWVWDLSTDDPALVRELEIEEGAQGHLEQDDDVVMFAMTDGYHIFNKATGQMLGKIRYMPDLTARNFSHLNNPPRFNAWPHQRETRKKKDTPIPLDDRHISLELKPGTSSDESHLWAESLGDMASQEWGAGMLCGSIMVGVSKEGFTVIVSDWPRLLKNQVKAADVVSFIECDPQDSDREVSATVEQDEAGRSSRAIGEEVSIQERQRKVQG
ncbi:hypothetical protein BCV69DRAFT_295994 [Microstroma glucosiphilum]|uniref:F-box domain-containing protein n=1 Tax=Pseudomicrostroma glucosiphilum TaxID=1684307 RepID=A0A316UEL8_9BASI|nr:hypothetical protein BCV69DRAFT_295994 [Pseudomicrostroma glucosiphilum]PWN23676.1 hypothetical protein BCV69DRAFT_295994 [Pseudomicrostroma glucosiphilum]